MANCIKSFVHTAWAKEHTRRSCVLILWSQILLLLSLLAISFVFVHVYLPNYNARRLSKYPLACSTVDNEWVAAEHCELPWDHNHITVERRDQARRLYENDSHSATVSLHKVAVLKSDAKATGNGSQDGNDVSLEEVATERHFTWSSCGEFCSSNLVDQFGCRQLRVMVRRLGSQLSLVGCTGVDVMECPFLGTTEKDPLSLNKNFCSTAEDKPCLRLGIFKCSKSERKSNPRGNVGEPQPTPQSQVMTTSVMSVNTSFESLLENFELVNFNASTENTSTSTTTSATTSTTSITPVPWSNATSIPSRSIITTHKNISNLDQELECTHIEKLISCNMSKLDGEGSSFRRFNCTTPSSQTCFKAPGTYVCDSESLCRKVPKPDRICSRTCEGIGLDDKNVVIADEKFERILTAKCRKAYREKSTKEVWPGGIKHKTDHKWRTTPQILVTCNRVDWTKLLKMKNQIGDDGKNDSIGVDFYISDCLNGTRLENVTLPASATLRELKSIWFLNLQTEDYHLDPIKMKDAPPVMNLTIQKSSPLYLNDFYRNMGEGCPLISNSNQEDEGESFQMETCTNFYQKYGRLPRDLKGQSLFPCYCRSLSEGLGRSNLSTLYCVVGDMKGVQVFDRYWEDGLVEFVQEYSIPILVFLIIILLCSLTLICLLLYPLIADLTPVNQLVLVGVTPTPSMRRSSSSRRSVKFMEEKMNTVFTVGGGGDGSPWLGPPRDEMQMEIRRSSRRNSIASFM